MSVSEEQFEEHIANYLREHGGYRHVKVGNVGDGPRDFDPETGIDTADLFQFIGATQADQWNRLLDSGYGGDPNKAQSEFVKRLAGELDKRGTVDVLRHGVVDRNITIKLAFFRPASGLTPELTNRYEANILNVTRQLPFDPTSNKTVDLALFVNGIPVATAELKNPYTNQTVENAIAQYRSDRSPTNRTLGRIGMVHFAVDPFLVSMTTRLAGARTRFLPFNRGHELGAGNPPNPDGHRTSYLWEQVWSRDNWMDILSRFIHVVKVSKGSRARPEVIFPRFHQWDAVRQLETAAKQQGAGHNYLIQHSAGSGKSNSIAWLAHRLSSLHNDKDTKVFDKVVVITDRIVLDRQLQETISQIEHAIGVVQRIDESSTQLAEALAGEQARIIITTLQKFPYILNKIDSLPERNYAIIVDEAHSSQTGKAAAELRRALGSNEPAHTEPAHNEPAHTEPDDDANLEDETTDVEALLAEAVAARGPQPNLSFFAFTATPKGRTLEMFGDIGDNDKHEPFHLYPMRQAIEERYIMDVLAGYLTYKQYYHLEKAILNDPQYDTDKARSALARFVTLHPDNLAQKAAIIVEHFQAKIAPQIAGKSKAMVVCSSRVHAVRMWHALKKHANSIGYGLGALVAFSGEVEGLTESKANGFGESQTAERFDTDEWQIMVVAEKFQTGFDQPKLAAMYVDKTLSGLAAVQTLSRLNRIHPDKSSTFVVDFVNDADEIRKAFTVYHGNTVAPPTDPNVLFDTRDELRHFDVLDSGEIERSTALLHKDNAHAQIYAAMQPAVERFRALTDQDQDAFRDALGRFVRVYGFLSLVVSFRSVELERDYRFCRLLASLIRDRNAAQSINLSTEVELTHLRHDPTFEGPIELPSGEGEVTTIYSGTGPITDPEAERLSEIIARINERFGTDWTEEDQLVFKAAAGDLITDVEIQNQAVNNDKATFRAHVFPARYEKSLLLRRDRNSDLIYTYLDSPRLQEEVLDFFAAIVQQRAVVAHQRSCPIGDLLGADRESLYLEYKSTLRWDINNQQKGGVTEAAVVKTIAGFANADYGGTLLIGVADDGSVCGLEDDFATFSKRGQRGDRDLWGQHLQNLICSRLGEFAMTLVKWEFHTVDGHQLARISIEPSPHPIQERKDNAEVLWHRTPTSTIAIRDPKDKSRIIATRWPSR